MTSRPRRKALADAELQKALLNVKRGFVSKRAAADAKLPEFDTLREEARAIKDHTLAHLDLYLEAYERKVIESGGEVHYAPAAADARDIVLRLCGRPAPSSSPRASRWCRRRSGSTPISQAARHRSGRDRSRRIYRAAQRRAAEPHHRARHPSQQRDDRGRISPEARSACRASAGSTGAEYLVAEARARAAREIPRRRCRHHRRQSADRRDRLVGDRHQRGQRRPDLDAAAHAYRHRLDREAGADARGRLDHPAAAGALGHRPGDHHLHDLRSPARAATAIPTVQPPITSCCSTMDGARCSATSSPTCCAASAAAPASITARSMARSAAMLTARSIPGRWARC